MDRVNKSSLLIATLLFAYSTLIQTSRAGDSVGAAQVDAIYSDIEKLYIDLHRNPELAFHEQRCRRWRPYCRTHSPCSFWYRSAFSDNGTYSSASAMFGFYQVG
jgi:hypothetical protein